MSNPNPHPIKPISRPNTVCGILQIVALLVLLLAIIGAIGHMVAFALSFTNDTDGAMGTYLIMSRVNALNTALHWLMIGLSLSGLLWGMSLALRYLYQGAVGAHLFGQRVPEMGAGPAEEGGEVVVGGEVAPLVTLLRDISENTLLTESEKTRKRLRLQEVRRERLKAEIEQLIQAMKWPEARARIEDFRLMNPDSAETNELGDRLERAIQEHQDLDVMTSCEQIRSYISLGLWSKAREAAQVLATKYPGNSEAQKMPGLVKLEEEVARKDERSRLYREIEHLVGRKHYRDAVHVAQSLLERYPESPEAATLRGQMDELNRNADIEVRREMEARIIECTRQNKHKEAYEVARALLEQYPESPQAIALKDQIDKLRERAGA